MHTLHPHPTGINQYLFTMERGVFAKRYWGLDSWWSAALALACMGTALRIGSFLGLKFLNRDKQA